MFKSDCTRAYSFEDKKVFIGKKDRQYNDQKKRAKEQTMIYKIQHNKNIKSSNRNPTKNRECAHVLRKRKKLIPDPRVAPVVLLLLLKQ